MPRSRTAAALVALLAAAPAFAEIPASMKAKRLAPPEPPPVTLSGAEEVALPVLGSCTAAAGACASYEGAFAGVDPRALCEKSKGTWSRSGCPLEGAIGACTQRQPSSEDRIVTRYYPPSAAEAARKACVSSPRGIFLQAK